MTNKTNQLNIKIYYEDTDAGGIVYHSKYLNFAERARTEFLNDFNYTHNFLLRNYQIRFVVKRLKIDYVSYAILDETLSLETSLIKITKARLTFNQLINNNERKVAILLAEVCCIGTDGKVARIPNDIYYKLIE